MNSLPVTLCYAYALVLAALMNPGVGMAEPVRPLLKLWPLFAKAASRCGTTTVSPATLAAIALVESGLDYRLLRVHSKSPVPELENSPALVRSWHDASKKRHVYVLAISCQQDLEQIRAVVSKASGYDAGLMQINRWWVNKLGLSLQDLMLCPEKNIQTGCMILSRALSRSGNLHDALEIYHHGHVADGRYAGKVLDALERLVNALVGLEQEA